jgi:hypothetical protein
VQHQRKGEWGEGKDQGWITEFGMDGCKFCGERLEHQLENWQTRCPDHPVLVLFTSAGTCFIEFQFVDPEDGVSEWTYWLVHEFDEEKRRKLGSTV